MSSFVWQGHVLDDAVFAAVLGESQVPLLAFKLLLHVAYPILA